jgi:hypothetical protein
MDPDFDKLFPTPLPEADGDSTTTKTRTGAPTEQKSSSGASPNASDLSSSGKRRFTADGGEIDLAYNQRQLVLDRQLEAMTRDPDGAQGVHVTVEDWFLFTMGRVRFLPQPSGASSSSLAAAATSTAEGSSGQERGVVLRFVGVVMFFKQW